MTEAELRRRIIERFQTVPGWNEASLDKLLHYIVEALDDGGYDIYAVGEASRSIDSNAICIITDRPVWSLTRKTINDLRKQYVPLSWRMTIYYAVARPYPQ